MVDPAPRRWKVVPPPSAAERPATRTTLADTGTGRADGSAAALQEAAGRPAVAWIVKPMPIIAGLFAAVGLLVVLQQAGAVLLSMPALAVALAAGGLAGVLLPSGAATLARAVAHRRAPRHAAALWMCVAVALFMVAVPGARGEVDGGCTGTLNGIDVTGPTKPVRVAAGTEVPFTFQSPEGVTSAEVRLHFGPFSTVVAENRYGGQESIEDSAAVDDYAWLGVGRYRLTGALETRGAPCGFVVDIDVQGNPLTTVAGAAGATMAGAGLAGLAVSGVAAARSAMAGVRAA